MSSKRHPPWTDQENIACVALYFVMLDNAVAGKPYNKAAMIREAQTGLTCRLPEADRTPHAGRPLAARSKGSIEAKLMNCSACHRDLRPNAETMDGHGYRALTNYQASLKTAMNEALGNGAALTDTQQAIIETRQRYGA